MTNILNVNVDNLMEEQLKTLKQHAINVLYKVISAIEREDLTSLKSYIEHSPAGDDMGCDNYYINFG